MTPLRSLRRFVLRRPVVVVSSSVRSYDPFFRQPRPNRRLKKIYKFLRNHGNLFRSSWRRQSSWGGAAAPRGCPPPQGTGPCYAATMAKNIRVAEPMRRPPSGDCGACGPLQCGRPSLCHHLRRKDPMMARTGLGADVGQTVRLGRTCLLQGHPGRSRVDVHRASRPVSTPACRAPRELPNGP